MREIKFRAWFKDTQEMKSVAMNNLYKENNSSWLYLSPQPMGNYRPVEVMQYTGLKDADGKEIYEGDVVKEDFADEYKVEYVEEYAGFLPFVNDGGCGCCSYIPIYLPHECKVIGNIYENPELLKGGE